MKHLSRRLMRNRRGGASVAIAVMMAMIIAVLFINKIVIGGQVLQREDEERMDESVEIISIQFNETKLIVGVRNTGSVTAHIVTMYIKPLDPTINTTRYGMDKGIDIYIDPGMTKQVIPDDLVLVPAMDPSDDFVVSVHTERGSSNSKAYTLETSPPLPEWFLESANPLVIMAGESSLRRVGQNRANLTMTIWNKSHMDIELKLIVNTNIVTTAPSSAKIEIIYINRICPAGDKIKIAQLIELSGGADGARIELVSIHNWVVGEFVFIL